MRILNEQDEEIQEEDVDLKKGYLMPDKVFVAHHDAVEAKSEEGHYYPETVYFEDDTSYSVQWADENDPHITPNEDGVSFEYASLEGEDEKEVRGMDVKWIIDQEQQDAKEAYDEYEDIQRYKLWTEEELQQQAEQKAEAEKRENFMSTGPDRLDNAESNIDVVSTNVDDITMLLADMIGA